MYRSDKLSSNGPRAAGETQVPIAGLDRSIPFRSCQALPGWDVLGWAGWLGWRNTCARIWWCQ